MIVDYEDALVHEFNKYTKLIYQASLCKGAASRCNNTQMFTMWLIKSRSLENKASNMLIDEAKDII
jgi:hypothetical protein